MNIPQFHFDRFTFPPSTLPFSSFSFQISFTCRTTTSCKPWKLRLCPSIWLLHFYLTPQSMTIAEWSSRIPYLFKWLWLSPCLWQFNASHSTNFSFLSEYWHSFALITSEFLLISSLSYCAVTEGSQSVHKGFWYSAHFQFMCAAFLTSQKASKAIRLDCRHHVPKNAANVAYSALLSSIIVSWFERVVYHRSQNLSILYKNFYPLLYSYFRKIIHWTL